MAEVADDVFDHDDGAVDHHAEVERAEREQVGGDVAEIEADGGEEQSERDGEGDDEGAAQVAEEEEQDDATRMMPSVRLCRTVWVVSASSCCGRGRERS